MGSDLHQGHRLQITCLILAHVSEELILMHVPWLRALLICGYVGRVSCKTGYQDSVARR